MIGVCNLSIFYCRKENPNSSLTVQHETLLLKNHKKDFNNKK